MGEESLGCKDTSWDLNLQEYHGGQDLEGLEDPLHDLSVTTNGLGMCRAGEFQAQKAEPAKTQLAKFISPSSWERLYKKLILGNGASELIDLVTRVAPAGPWKSGAGDVQYKEYHRSAVNSGRKILSNSDPQDATLYSFVNPNNPTGSYLHLADMKALIETLPTGCSVIVDESMQPWHSRDFRSDSLTSQCDWLEEIYNEREISVYIIHSWTKLWTCCGLRIGSVISSTKQHADKLKSMQVPWSVNIVALKYLEIVTSPESTMYLEVTWELTPKWRKYLHDAISAYAPTWVLHGEPFLSWIWIDTKCIKTSERAIETSRRSLLPIRPGLHGYNAPTFIRVAVRPPPITDKLLDSWRRARVYNDIV